jgi:hypothetical protein
MRPCRTYVTCNRPAALIRVIGFALLLAIPAGELFAQNGSRSRLSLGKHDLKDDSYTVYPNPSSGKFSVQVKEQEKPYDINVYNLIGEMVFHWESQGNGPASLEVNLTRQPRGVYFVELDTERGNVLKKIIIDYEKDN